MVIVSRDEFSPGNSSTVWRDIVCGAIAGGFGESVMHPIDTVKTRMQCGGHFGLGKQMHRTGQALKSILATDGLKGLYRGIGPALTGSVISGATYFGCIELTREWLLFERPDLSSPYLCFLSGAAGDIIGSIVYVPCEVMKQRMQVQGSKTTWLSTTLRYGDIKTPNKLAMQYYSGLYNVGASILQSEGPRGLYAGYMSTLVRDVPFAGLQIVIYESLKKTQANKSSEANALEELMMGGVAGGLSAYLTTPLDVIKTRLQVQGTSARYTGWRDACKTILKEEGLAGLLKGWLPRVTWVIPASALTFMVYENLRRLE